jgi:transposase
MSPIDTWIGLKGYRVTRSESKPPLRVVAEPVERPECCLHCGARHLHSKGRYKRRVKHLRSFGAPVRLVVECRRYQCLECGRSFVQPLGGLLDLEPRAFRHGEKVPISHSFQMIAPIITNM